jgi:chaperonin GroES
MTTGLYLPEHLVKKKAKAKKNGSESDTEKLPKPTGWRILVMPYNPPKTTKGGIELPDTVVERERVATVVGLVMDMGPLCYQDTAKFGPSTTLNREWCKKGDWVIFARYAGSRFKIEGGELRLLNDDEILAVVEDPEFLIHT